MTVNGLQKLTLLDYPGKTGCTVFLSGCNLRCPFCHNAELANGCSDEEITEDELFAFLSKRRGILDGVCVTGGEPLLRTELPELFRKIKSLGFAVKLDTNGLLFSRLRDIISEGLVDYIAMDIKNAPAKYAVTCGMDKANIGAVYKSIEAIINSGIDYEFRTTAVAEYHTPSDFYDIARMIEGAKIYYIQNFVDSGRVMLGGLHSLSENELRLAAEEARKVIPEVRLRGI